MRYSFALVSMLLSAYVSRSAGQDCATVIALSKTVMRTTVERKQFDQEANNFCSRYNRGATSESDMSFAASYKFLSAAFGQDSASKETIASEVCSSGDRSSSSTDAYYSYVQSIAPEAYDAYKTCLQSKSIKYAVEEGTVLPTEFTLTASYRAGSAAVARLQATPSQGVDCSWSDTGTREIVLGGKGPFSAALRCVRKDQTVKSYVTIINASVASEQINIPWRRYNREGEPVDTVASLQKQLSTVSGELAGLKVRADTLSHQVSDTFSVVHVPTNELTQLIAQCDPNDLKCLAAAHRYCEKHGYKGGVPQEWTPSDTLVICFGR